MRQAVRYQLSTVSNLADALSFSSSSRPRNKASISEQNLGKIANSQTFVSREPPLVSYPRNSAWIKINYVLPTLQRGILSNRPSAPCNSTYEGGPVPVDSDTLWLCRKGRWLAYRWESFQYFSNTAWLLRQQNQSRILNWWLTVSKHYICCSSVFKADIWEFSRLPCQFLFGHSWSPFINPSQWGLLHKHPRPVHRRKQHH